MQTNWQSIVKDYFTFTKKERRGILLMLCLCMAALLMGNYWPVAPLPVLRDGDFAKEIAALHITPDSTTGYQYRRRSSSEEDFEYTRPSDNYAINRNKKKTELFVFDPNTLPASGWARLGIREKTISTIEKLLGKGFRFKSPEDIKKIYGLRPDEAERLIPYVQIEPMAMAGKDEVSTRKPDRALLVTKTVYVDINRSDTSDWIALPGIGSRLANRIVNFREKLGGFVSIDQVGETFGLPDSTFRRIADRLQFTSPVLRTLNINQATADELKAHPYISVQLARAIVQYRQQHGLFASTSDLKRIHLVNDETFNKIAPYVVP